MSLYLKICLLLLAHVVSAQKIFLITEASESYPFPENHLGLFVDSTKKLEAKDLLSSEIYSTSVNIESIDFKKYNFWLRFSIKNNSSNPTWFFEILNFGIDHVAFYDISENRYIETGYAHFFKSRLIHHKNFVFALSIQPGQTKTYLVKVSSPTAFRPIFKIHSDQYFIAYSVSEYVLLGLYYGLLLLFFSYNLFLFISLREISYLSYIFYVLAIAATSLQWDGLAFQYLWPESPQMNKILEYSPLMLLCTFSIYAINFLGLRKRNLRMYFAIIASVLLYLIAFFINPYFAVPYLSYLNLLPYTFVFIASIRAYQYGYFPVRFFVLGYVLLFFSQLAHLLLLHGLMLESGLAIMYLVYSVHVGFIGEIYLFSIAQADKVRWIKREKEKAQQAIIEQLIINDELKDKVNRELGAMVAERTRELEIARIKLQEHVDEINRMNSLLDLENHKLKSDVKELSIDRGLLKLMSVEELEKIFPDKNACYRFIEEIKWGTGFECVKCGNKKYTDGNILFSRRCTKCNYIETIKANTIFHNIKFPIEKAFKIIYLILATEKEISSYALSSKLNLQQKTCWTFSQKVIDAIKKQNISKKSLMESGWGILIHTKK